MTNNCSTPIELLRNVDGEPMLSPDALSLMFGIDVEVIEAHAKRTMADGHIKVPYEWIQAGRRRASEAATATGSRDMLDSLCYWAERDRGAQIVRRPDGDDR
jgi:hypothetical protein